MLKTYFALIACIFLFACSKQTEANYSFQTLAENYYTNFNDLKNVCAQDRKSESCINVNKVIHAFEFKGLEKCYDNKKPDINCIKKVESALQ